MPASTPRVVSLVPSVTETLLAWGIVPVGVTRFCEHPELPAFGGTKNPDVAAIAALAPDLVVVEREENRLEDATALEAAGVDLLVLHVRSLDDVGPEMARLAARLGVAAPEPPADGAPAPVYGGLRAWVPIWRRPWMTVNGDTYGSSVLAALGVVNVFAAAADRYPTVTLDEVAARHPDVVLAPTEPYPFAERHLAELRQVAPVRLVDGQDLFWWGARTTAALERLGRGGLAPRPGEGEG